MRLLLAAVVLLSGCSTITPQPATADRAAGTVTFLVDRYGSPAGSVDWHAAQAEAVRRCGAWGYASAEPMAVLCDVRSLRGGCADSRFTRQYQCVD